jgi:acyl-coenzyme A thioesterase PaaI-like protein
LQIKSYWDGEESVCTFTPRPYHIAIPGYVYGGLIASLIDCHCTGTASAAAYRAAGREMGTEPLFRYVTGTLHVEYVRPTPLGAPLESTSRKSRPHHVRRGAGMRAGRGRRCRCRALVQASQPRLTRNSSPLSGWWF